MKLRITAAMTAAAAMGTALPAMAQEATPVVPATAAVAAPIEVSPPGAAPVVYVESAPPFGLPTVTNADAAAVEMPVLAFTSAPADSGNFDKYFYFNRPDTDFATAYADLRECDGYARGLQSGITYQDVPYPYAGTLGGAIGGAIGNAMAAAIFGSAEKRRLRRVNMRTCMGFKGYARYGLPKELWEKFHFEEGLSGVGETERDRKLRQQALVASSVTPQGQEIGL